MAKRKLFKKIKSKFKKSKFSEKFANFFSSNFVSIIALILSVITLYYQFFNVKHEVLYSFLTPSFVNNYEELTVPIFFKNTGNQTELILNANLILEVKTENNKNYYKRIGDDNLNQFPIILNSDENKFINLKAKYYDYLSGILELSPNGLIYRDFTILDSLKFKLTTEFMTKNGYLSKDTIDIGFITFDENKKISQLDYNATQMRKMNLKSDTELTGGTILNMSINRKINLKNPEDKKRNEAILKYMERQINDSTFSEMVN